MRRTLAVVTLALTFFASPTLAQIPPQLRSAGVTETQWAQAQGVIRAQATSLNLREEALRTLAVEIFEAQPGQSFQTYIELIREGASLLPQALAAARALNPRGDATLADLQSRAVAAAEAGRLREALALQDQYSAAFSRALARAIEAPQLELAASYAAAGETAYALADHLGAAARYQQAIAAAPAGAAEIRWRYTVRRANALAQRSYLFAEPAPLAEAVRILETEALPLVQSRAQQGVTHLRLGSALFFQGERGDNAALTAAGENYTAAFSDFSGIGQRTNAMLALRGLGDVRAIQGDRGSVDALAEAVAIYEDALSLVPRDTSPAIWASIQSSLGQALTKLGARRVPGALERAVGAFEAALTVWTRESDPADWALVQMNLANALHRQHEQGVPGTLDLAVAAHRAALTVYTRDTDPAGWALVQMNLGASLRRQGDLAGAITALEAAHTIMTRDADPDGWATIHFNLGRVYADQGARGVTGARERAVTALETSLTVRTREAYPASWASNNEALARVFRDMGRNADARAAAQRAIEGYTEVGDEHAATAVRTLLAELPSD